MDVTTSRPVRLALIGCGSHSRGNHAQPMARYAAAHPAELDLAAACDLDVARARSFCAEFGFRRAYDDAEKMLAAESLDGCVSVMPVRFVVAEAIRLLERGMPCVVEKPLGATLEEARRLAAAAARTGTPHMVSVNRRFNPYIRRALAWAREQGPIRFVRGVMARKGRAEPEFGWSTGIHGVDTMRFLGGEVAAFDWRAGRGPRPSARWYTVEFAFRDGAVGRLDILPTAGWIEETYELIGEGFRVVVSTQQTNAPTTLHGWRDGAPALDVASAPDEPQDVTIGPYAEVEEFVCALRQGVAPVPSVAEILPSMEICFTIAAKE